MKLFASLIRRLFFPLTGFLLFVLLAQYNIQLIALWLDQLHWLPYLSLGFAALICLQFGRTRLFISSVACVAIYWSMLSISVHLEYIVSCMMVCVSWLLWRPDKGLQWQNSLMTVLEVAMIAVIGWFGLPWLEQLLAPLTANMFSFLFSLGPLLSAHYSPFQLIFIASLLLLGMARLVFLPTNNQIALFVLLLGLALIIAQSSVNFVQLVFIGLSIIFIVATLVDSFNMAFRDELTGIPSRRAMVQFVQTLGRKYIVVMCDIDHFKKFNDTYGHDVGDQVLKLVASKMQQVTGGGKAFRYGGEEFTLIFPRKAEHEVAPHVDVLRQLIAEYPIVLRGQDRPKHPPKKNSKTKNTKAKPKTVHVTCSFGLAERNPDFQQFEQVMKQADKALYAAKKAGRNCVKSAI